MMSGEAEDEQKVEEEVENKGDTEEERGGIKRTRKAVEEARTKITITKNITITKIKKIYNQKL